MFIKDNIRENSTAEKKLDTIKPSTKKSVSIIISAFTTKVNSPRVRRVMGKESIVIIGFIKIFIKVRTKTTTKRFISPAEVKPPVIETPGMK